MTGTIDFEQVCAMASLRDVAGSVVRLRRAGREWTGCCPFHAENSPSFTIYEAGGRDRYKCFGCGAAGDVVSFVARYYGIDTLEAVRHLTGGNLPSRAAPSAPPRDEAKERAERARLDHETAKARAVWTGAATGAGSPVEAYLREARCIDIGRIGGVPASLRFARLPYWRAGEVGFERIGVFPAMVAPIQRAAGAVIGVHVTYLDPDGGGKLRLADPDLPGKSLPAKKVRGTLAGGAIRLGPTTRHVYLAEGIETGLSVAVSVAGRKKGSVWTAISLNNFGAAGLPESVREVTILADNDGKTPGAGQKDPRDILREQARALSLRGFAVRIAWPPPGMDFNDVLRGQHGA